MKPNQRKANILQGPVSQIIKVQKLERPRIDLIAQLFGQTVRQALIHYSEEDKDLWLKPDVEATCEFMEFSSKFFNSMNMQETDEGLDEEKCQILKEISSYMRNVAIPSGVLVKSTAQGIIQTSNATLKLVKILMDKIGLSPFFTARLQKRALWTQMVEHSLFREKMK